MDLEYNIFNQPNKGIIKWLTYLRVLRKVLTKEHRSTAFKLVEVRMEMTLMLNLNNYFDFHVCLSFCLRLPARVQRLTSIPAGVSQNVTNKSEWYVLRVKNLHLE